MSKEVLIAIVIALAGITVALFLISPLYAPKTETYVVEVSSNLYEMLYVEGGSFTMGDEFGDLWGWCGPVHQVTLTYDFYIGRHEVTFDEYDAFCDTTGRIKPPDGPSWSEERWGRGSRPVINVSWWDAIAYCNWLSEEEGLPVAYLLLGETDEGQLLDEDGNVTTDITKVVGYRLPTEAEWEYAARGGKHQSPYKFSGSDAPDDVAWYRGNSGGMTHEVGQKIPNALGIYDMSGNVSEWCTDYYADYTDAPRMNPYVSSGTNRVARGGRWSVVEQFVRVAFRSDGSPGYKIYDLGFRVARTAP